MIKHILFPFDFSERCRQVVPFVTTMAAGFGAKVTLINVSPQRELQSPLEGVMQDESTQLQVERVADSGDPAARITRFAHAHKVDLIMMPTRGHGALRGLLIGSVTAKVLEAARPAVWTAAHVTGETARDHSHCRNILCAVEGTARSIAVARWAEGFSVQAGAGLSLVHVVPRISDWPSLESERSLQEEVREKARASITSLLRSAGVAGPVSVAVGDVCEVVTEEGGQHGADLIIIGRGSIHEPMGRLRTHAQGIIQRSPCPVLSV